MPNLATRELPIAVDGYRCVGGPLDGATLYLSEHSPNTAHIECRQQLGRYVAGRYMEGKLGRLVWRPDIRGRFARDGDGVNIVDQAVDYRSFLESKVRIDQGCGFDIDPAEMNPALKDHTRAMVRWAVNGGRRALFAAFGLHKTCAQLEIMRLIGVHRPCLRLITLPLGVRQEFFRDARERFTGEHAISLKFIRRAEEIEDDRTIYLTNYESVREGILDIAAIKPGAVSLDEASILRGFGGTKTFRELMAVLAGDDRRADGPRTVSDGVQFRFVATATPSPNEYIEILAYAAFLGVMDIGQAKTRFFKRDSTKADALTIHAHKEAEFWLWVASWALFVQRPSDLGFDDEGYALPALDVRWHEIASDHTAAGTEKDGQGKMFKSAAIGVVEASREKRSSMPARIEKLREIIADGRSAQAVSERVLREEQGPAAGEATGSKSEKLSGEQGWPSTSREAVARAQSGAGNGIGEAVPGAEPGSAAGEEPGSLPQQPEEGGAQPRHQTGPVRPDVGAVRGDFAKSTGKLRDLLHANDGAARGPRSRDRRGARAAVHEVQQRAGAVQRQSGSAHASSSLPDQIVIWCDLNDEQDAIGRALDAEGISCASLYGAQSVEDREQLVEAWRSKERSVFLTKPSMYGAGINLQQSHSMIFAGIGFKFYEFVQALHRIQRFGQQHPCTAHLIYTESEREVRRELERKWAQHVVMVDKMTAIIREYGLANASMAHALHRSIGCERAEASGKSWTLVNNDCVEETRSMPADSVGLIVTSIPFSHQYEYSPSYNDFGHTDDNMHFWRQMDFLTPELMRVLQPGRVCAIHVKDRITPGGINGFGFQTVSRISDACADHFEKHGFAFLGRKTVVTDVVRENNQTYRLGWSEQCKDGSRMGAGLPEYVMLFRKPPTDRTNGYADQPVVKDKKVYTRPRWQYDAHGYLRSSGNRMLQPEDLDGLAQEAIYKLFRKYSTENVYDFARDVALAEHVDKTGWLPSTFMLMPPASWHPDVWTDITRMRTLNANQAAKGKEMHLCPMQFDIVDRLVTQFSMEGEVVFDPFVGIGTTVARAVRLGRRGIGIELSSGYYKDAIYYCDAEEWRRSTPSLFDALREIDQHREVPATAPIDAPLGARPSSTLGDSQENRSANHDLDGELTFLSAEGHA